jgi:peptidoglycan hydrolase-like protein with peptidoglycan-binding domain
MPLPYQKPGLTLSSASGAQPDMVRSLQRHLRILGYKAAGINGVYDNATERAVRALQIDLLKPAQSPATAGGGISQYNGFGGGARVTAVTGAVDEALANCISAMLADAEFAELPESENSSADNARALAAIRSHTGSVAPSPFVVAIVQQESGGRHYLVPRTGDEDAFVTIGLDRNKEGQPDEITSRGYGLGQYTLDHHPPTPAEVRDFIHDPINNVHRVYDLLRKKLDRTLVGPDDHADDRKAEHPLLPLRLCRYAPADTRYMSDCVNCARAARKVNIAPQLPVYKGAITVYAPTQYYSSATYTGIPDRADFLCDWPYAVRRYNGGGINSFHYQTRVLRNLLALGVEA